MRWVGAVLAAGRATRFDPPGAKLRTPLGGRALLTWALSACADARLLAARAVVVGRDRFDDLVPTGFEVIVNPHPERGLASSLALAAAWAEADGASGMVVGLADQPFITAQAWDAVAAAPEEVDLAVATYAGSRANPVRIARRLFGALPVSGDVGARALFARRDLTVVSVSCQGDPMDVDTRHDLSRAEERADEGEGG
ncbi:4-diphosphocytidyl-2C-methyl-D-erythritolsynthase [Acidimicrobium ferrooxidans DSM 10331]|uniref:4-diphosphocytidyl-2C-methyl-D-erythritolsynthase n=1 Tax=Acidimicrobium ferrooxidans (strain DSM 10331 / JCM 15462 / NBRC 103882 / ICP) TaxID=525909 RepID=C7M0H8_ACIFD|nr:4-diphosphocytidyl-2C-methyl-D-erythritolsynthase [Acidimicrobium ferrooxidans DSM 10331]